MNMQNIIFMRFINTIKSVTLKCIIIFFFLLGLANTNSAQSSQHRVRQLALKCTNGDAKSCRKLLHIIRTDKSIDIRIFAVQNVTDQKVLSGLAGNLSLSDRIRIVAIELVLDQTVLAEIAINPKNRDKVQKAALNKITDQSMIEEFARDGESFGIRKLFVKKITDQNTIFDICNNIKHKGTQLVALNCLDEYEYYNELVEIINTNYKTNSYLAKIAALKIMPQDQILGNYYDVLEVEIDIDQKSQNYYLGFMENEKPRIRRRLLYDIDVKSDQSNQSFHFEGRKGGDAASESDLTRLHMGTINIDEICEFLLSPICREDLLTISEDSDIYYLRETAKTILGKN